MATPFTPGERRVARFLFVVALVGTFWHLYEGLRPPPPPLVLERRAFGPDAAADSVLYEGGSPAVSHETGIEYPLDLISAGVTELMALPGIGPVLADRIVAWRSSQTGEWQLDDLMDIRGIGPATVERIRPLVGLPEQGARDTLGHTGEGPGGSVLNRPRGPGEWR